jgi:hypothetical protein
VTEIVYLVNCSDCGIRESHKARCAGCGSDAEPAGKVESFFRTLARRRAAEWSNEFSADRSLNLSTGTNPTGSL